MAQDRRELARAAAWIGSVVVGLATVGVAIVIAWTSFELPRVAWSTDIDRLDRNQIKLAIDFYQEKSLNLFHRVLLVDERIEKTKLQPQVQVSEEYLKLLLGRKKELELEIKRTDEHAKALQNRALELEGQ